MARTGFFSHPDCERHDPGAGHPERPDRLRAIAARLASSGLLAEVDARRPEPADIAWIERLHDSRYVQAVARACAKAPALLDGGDTVVSTGSLRAALLAVGGALQACDRVQRGDWKNAFVACRPPGHHAEQKRAMGFCLFNQVAIAAKYLREKHRLERVAILDFDVHHGNGTQHAFEADPTVYYASLHQWPLYPGTGAATERGLLAGEGTTLNCPQPAGAGEKEWLRALEQQVLPEFERFRPQFLLLSAGFDGHAADPLAQTELETDSFRRITELCVDLARRHCGGRIVSVLEGGYDLDALADSVHAHVATLHTDPH